MVQACTAVATDCETSSASHIKELYAELGSLPGNIDVTFDGTWLTRGRSSHICVGCIIEMYTGLVTDHVVLSNFCLACSTGLKPGDEGDKQTGSPHLLQCAKKTLTATLCRWK